MLSPRLLCAAFVLLAACSAVAPPVAAAPAPGPAVHVVKPGETLWRIARQYDLTPEELGRLNGIADITKVRVGTELKVSARSPTPQAPAKAAAAAPASPAPAVRPRYPLRWPVEGQIASRYGQKAGAAHDGIDIVAPEGTTVRAAAPGKVLFSAEHEGYGNLVVVKHDDGLVTVYAHHQANLVRKGQSISLGQPIAKVGKTGNASGPHLHFEVRKGAVPQNPLAFLPP